MSDHPWNDWRVTAYALGELDERERAAFEQELATDPDLQQAVAEVSRITQAVTDALGREPTPKLSEARRAELFSHFSGEGPMHAPTPTHDPEKRHPGRRRFALPLAIAASLCLVIGGAAWFAMRADRFQAFALQSPAVTSADQEEAVQSSQNYRQSSEDSPPPLSGPVESREAAPATELSALGAEASTSHGPAVESPSPAAADEYRYAAPISGDRMAMEGMGMEGARPQAMGMGGMGMQATPSGETSAESRFSRLGEGQGMMGAGFERLYGDFAADQGRGPGQAGDRFEPLTDNPFLRVTENPLSTFSIDVDTASYSKVRQYLMEQNQLPRPDAVRIEELVNYFEYDYTPPASDAEHPFAASLAVASCPWNPEHRLARIGIQGRTVENDRRPPSNLVFLLDVSGSMNQPNKLPLVRRGMQMLLEQLGENDRVAIVVYAGAAGMVLDSTPADRRQHIFEALERLHAGGSTNGGQGIQLAYATARDHFIPGGTNRVILCTDGDFNVGTTGTDQLVRMVESEAKGGTFLTVLGFGMGNHNDAMLEKISGRGNGNYAFIDTASEARKVLVQQTAGTLVTIAKDVKIQVEFNPTRVAGYRLIGYENRLLAKEDFNDDTKDAGEIGAGHSVTALYELVPAGKPVEAAAVGVDPLKYQTPASHTEAAESDELLTLKMRYKQPDGDESTLVQFPAEDSGRTFEAADDDFRFAAAVAGFGMLLRDSPYKGAWTFAAVEQTAREAQGEDAHGFRSEFVRMVQKAAQVAGHPQVISNGRAR